MNYIGVDLHTTQATVCYLTSDGSTQVKAYKLEQMDDFKAQLQDADQIAVEATGNTRWFVNQVKALVTRVVVVNPRQFEVIRRSAKKTDKNDAICLARFLQADLLPEVREKNESQERVRSLNQTREKLVRLRTTLINKVHGMIVSQGRLEQAREIDEREWLAAGH